MKNLLLLILTNLLFLYFLFFLYCYKTDINTPLTSPSGNMHGMPLGYFLGESGFENGKVPGFEWMDDLYGALSPEKLVYVGLRDVDAGEVEMLRRLNVARYFFIIIIIIIIIIDYYSRRFFIIH